MSLATSIDDSHVISSSLHHIEILNSQLYLTISDKISLLYQVVAKHIEFSVN